jgi:hypothetical protein
MCDLDPKYLIRVLNPWVLNEDMAQSKASPKSESSNTENINISFPEFSLSLLPPPSENPRCSHGGEMSID